MRIILTSLMLTALTFAVAADAPKGDRLVKHDVVNRELVTVLNPVAFPSEGTNNGWLVRNYGLTAQDVKVCFTNESKKMSASIEADATEALLELRVEEFSTFLSITERNIDGKAVAVAWSASDVDRDGSVLPLEVTDIMVAIATMCARK